MSLTTREFRNPGSWWRSAPFWSWNYDLTPKSVAREAGELLKAGMGGFFCHSRWGLETPYMGREWMDCIRSVLAEAKRRGGLCWLYDEDRWPSGAAGGLVTGPNPEYRIKYLVADWPPDQELRCSNKKLPLDKREVARFAVRMRGSRAAGFRRLSRGQWPARGERLMVASRVLGGDNGWYNGAAYLDTMDPEAVRAFVEHTYEGYRKAVGREFGKAVPGIFTDEPNYCHQWTGGIPGDFAATAWTDRLPAEFRRRCGYDLVAELPHLFLDIDDRGLKVRRDHRMVATGLFEEAFSRQVGQWCVRNRVAFTGHYLSEENLKNQTKVVGAAMPHYRHMGLPGIDILRRSIDEVLTCKQVASMAEQFGKPRVLSELYGGAGWHFSLADQKWMGDWQYALGVNLRCQHLVLTSLRGGRKRDYPPSFFTNTPWWGHNRVVEDYFGRLSLALSQGRAVRDLLVVHPMESAWALLAAKSGEPSEKKLEAIDRSLAALVKDLLGLHHDYDMGDESVMARFGRSAGGRLTVGRASYRAVLVPQCLTLRKTTLLLLEKFAAGGGRVLYVAPAPRLLDGAVSNEPARVLARIGQAVSAKPRELGRALDAALERRVTLRAAGGGAECAEVIYMLRRDGPRQLLFLANTDFGNAKAGLELELRGAPAGVVEEWDLAGGEVRKVAGAVRSGGVWRLGVDLPATGSRLLVFGVPSGRARPAAARLRPAGRKEVGSGGWEFRRSEPNALTLDLCRWRVRDGALQGPTLVRRAEEAIRRELDYHYEDNGSMMRWKRYLPEDLKRERSDGPRVELEFEFLVRDVPRGRFALAMERPGRFQAFLNGREVPVRPKGSFCDECIETVPLPAPRRGRNVLRLVTGYRPEHELEDVYLVGDFAVAAGRARELVAEPKKLRRGSWTAQGLPHYGGAVTYVVEVPVARPAAGERVFLKVDGAAGTSMELAVNGRRAGVMPWPPYELDVTGLLKAGTNRVELTVVGSRRNLLGPLHGKPPEPTMIGPGSFAKGDEHRYNLLPHGLTGRVWLERRKVAGR